MNHGLPCSYCNGETLHACAANLEIFDNGFLRVTGEDFQLFAAAATVRVSERLGRVPYFLVLPEGGTVELPAGDEAAALVAALRSPSRLAQALHWLETRARVATAATILLAAGVALTLWQGMPRLARHIAFLVPANIEAQAGLSGYAVLARALQPSELSARDASRVQRALERLEQTRKFHLKPQLRRLRLGTPNAFALPGGIVIVSDELVHLVQNDDELTAVLAHELGHVEKRHGLQSVLRNSSSLIVVSTVTGDLSTLSTFSGTLPFLLLQYGYAREFEREADAYAVDLLREAHIDPTALGAILQRLEENRPDKSADFSYLSTHPSNAERLRLLREKIAGKSAAVQ